MTGKRVITFGRPLLPFIPGQASFALHTGQAAGPPGKVAGKNGQGPAVKRARSHFSPGTLPVQSVIACCLAHFPPARSQPKNSTLPVRRSSPSAEPSPVSPVIHPFGRATSGFVRHSRLDRESSSRVFSFSKLSFSAIRVIRRALDLARPSFISFGRAFSRFARHSPPSAASPPVSPVIHPLRPRLFRFRSSFTSFGRASSRFARHSPPSAAHLPVSPVIPGWVGKRVITFGVFPYLCRI